MAKKLVEVERFFGITFDSLDLEDEGDLAFFEAMSRIQSEYENGTDGRNDIAYFAAKYGYGEYEEDDEDDGYEEDDDNEECSVESRWVIKVLDKAGKWYDNAIIENDFDALQVAKFYQEQLGYEVQLWHNDKDVTFLVSSAQNVIVN